MLKLLDYFFFSRPVLFFPAWSTLLIARAVSDNASSQQWIYQDIQLMLIMVVFALLMGSAFIVNQMFDIETDTINKKLFFLEKKIITLEEAKYLLILLAVIGFIISAFISVYIWIISLIFFLFAAMLYNIRPFRWKDHWFLGTFSNFVFGICAFLYGIHYDIFTQVKTEFYIMSLFNVILCILTTIPDQKGDVDVGKKTIANVLGVKQTLFVILIINIVMTYFLLIHNLADFFYIIVISSLLANIIMLFKSKDEIVLIFIRALLLIEALIAAYLFPDYLLLVLLMYFIGRWYYRKRFNLNYPSLINE